MTGGDFPPSQSREPARYGVLGTCVVDGAERVDSPKNAQRPVDEHRHHADQDERGEKAHPHW